MSDVFKMTNARHYEVCAGIDFGTTSCALAYSYPYQKNRVFVATEWPDGTTSTTVPTVALFDKDEKLVAFGEEAISKYSEHIIEKDHKKFYFFQNFKMVLYNSKV